MRSSIVLRIVVGNGEIAKPAGEELAKGTLAGNSARAGVLDCSNQRFAEFKSTWIRKRCAVDRGQCLVKPPAPTDSALDAERRRIDDSALNAHKSAVHQFHRHERFAREWCFKQRRLVCREAEARIVARVSKHYNDPLASNS